MGLRRDLRLAATAGGIEGSGAVHGRRTGRLRRHADPADGVARRASLCRHWRGAAVGGRGVDSFSGAPAYLYTAVPFDRDVADRERPRESEPPRLAAGSSDDRVDQSAWGVPGADRAAGTVRDRNGGRSLGRQGSLGWFVVAQRGALRGSGGSLRGGLDREPLRLSLAPAYGRVSALGLDQDRDPGVHVA